MTPRKDSTKPFSDIEIPHETVADSFGDGLGSDVQSWLEGCVARSTIRNAGEFNGFLKPKDRLLDPPLTFTDGSLKMPAGYRPKLDRAAVELFTTARLDFHFEGGRVKEISYAA